MARPSLTSPVWKGIGEGILDISVFLLRAVGLDIFNGGGRFMQCPSCSSPNPDEARFCLACGAQMIAVCPGCGQELPPDARFCHRCGASLTASPPNVAAAAPASVPASF